MQQVSVAEEEVLKCDMLRAGITGSMKGASVRVLSFP
jgi:hypothetical protein